MTSLMRSGSVPSRTIQSMMNSALSNWPSPSAILNTSSMFISSCDIGCLIFSIELSNVSVDMKKEAMLDIPIAWWWGNDKVEEIRFMYGVRGKER